ncbi:MAG: FtsX-like permease family protein, partial [Firmicutes bacterium]|nr:FtsX-like permease family protein [Bacillota bacterium]
HGEYLVIGVLDPPPEGEQGYSAFRGGNMGYVPLTASPYWPGAGRGPAQSFNHVSIGVDAGADLLQAHRRLADEARFLWGEEVVVQSPLQEYREMQRSIQQYALLIGAFASLGLVIAVINILNLMLARVLKRTKFIGLSLALGSSRRMVFGQFVLEALALGIIGSLLGVLVSFGFGALLGKTLGTVLTETMSGVRLLLGVSIGLAVSLFFGVYPAYLGSRINPGDALRSD